MNKVHAVSCSTTTTPIWVAITGQDVAEGTLVRHKRTKKMGSVYGSKIHQQPVLMPHGDGYQVQFEGNDSLDKVYIKYLVRCQNKITNYGLFLFLPP